MKCRCGLNTNRMSRQLYGKRKVLVQLHYKGQCWCDFSADEVLMQCHGKDEYWHGFSANKVLMWLHGKDECWHGFDANEVLMWLGANIGATSMRVQVQIFFSRQSNGDASMQMQELTQFHNKDKW